MAFEVLILGSDANAYYMARCLYEAYHKKAYLIGKDRLAFTRFSNILTITYEPKIWDEKIFLKTLDQFQKKHQGKKIILIKLILNLFQKIKKKFIKTLFLTIQVSKLSKV